ncbi:MAG: Response regulator rcp1 [Betaproteobacteria bacterium ADurb.Bin341]|nr:MAG: Response regulator rcp1 [Betaproteobacteria bacterium ADurb.Bin341]
MGSENAVDILLAEDNSADAELTMRALRKSRLFNRIEWVKDGAAVLDYLFCRGDYANRPCGNPRLVLLDLSMPKVSGLEVLQQMRADERTRLVPVVVMTSSKEEWDVVESYQFGANSYVQKPVAFDEFSNTVGKLGLYWLLINSVPTSQHTDVSVK